MDHHRIVIRIPNQLTVYQIIYRNERTRKRKKKYHILCRIREVSAANVERRGPSCRNGRESEYSKRLFRCHVPRTLSLCLSSLLSPCLSLFFSLFLTQTETHTYKKRDTHRVSRHAFQRVSQPSCAVLVIGRVEKDGRKAHGRSQKRTKLSRCTCLSRRQGAGPKATLDRGRYECVRTPKPTSLLRSFDRLCDRLRSLYAHLG